MKILIMFLGLIVSLAFPLFAQTYEKVDEETYRKSYQVQEQRTLKDLKEEKRACESNVTMWQNRVDALQAEIDSVVALGVKDVIAVEEPV